MKRSYLLGAVLVLTSLTLMSCAKSQQKSEQTSSSTSSSVQVKRIVLTLLLRKARAKTIKKENVLAPLSLAISISQVNGLNLLMRRLMDLFNIPMVLPIISLP